jgi:topoisomerase IA-like protein
MSFEEMTEEVARVHVMEYTMGHKPIMIGTYQDYPLQKKSGKFGPYIEWNTVHIPWIEDETMEETIARLIAKQTVVIREFKHFIIREGKFGPYVMKIGLKKPQFVAIPKGIDLATLTEKDVEGIYRLGSKGKKESIERDKKEKTEKKEKT